MTVSAWEHILMDDSSYQLYLLLVKSQDIIVVLKDVDWCNYSSFIMIVRPVNDCIS